MKTFYICTASCTRRRLDAEKIAETLRRNDWKQVDKVSEARDLAIVNTCGFSYENETLSLNAIKESVKKKPSSCEVLVTGCLTGINPDSIKELGDFHLVGPRELEMLDEILELKSKFNDTPSQNLSDVPALLGNPTLTKFMDKFSFDPGFAKLCFNKILEFGKRKLNYEVPFNIRISWGCPGKCTYCAIKFATKSLKSKPLDEIMTEFRSGLDQGFGLFNITAGDTGAYGLDIGMTFIDFLNEIFKFEEDFKLILSDFSPQWLIEYFDDLLPIFRKHNDRFAELCCPLQAGSNHVLELMKRPYTVEDAVKKITAVKEVAPQMRLVNNIIVGFPQETEQDFKDSQKMAKDLDFMQVRVHKYCDRPRTLASKMDGKIPDDEITRRYNAMLSVCSNCIS